MRFDLQAFQATTRPMTEDESQANMAALVALCPVDPSFVSVEQDLSESPAEALTHTSMG